MLDFLNTIHTLVNVSENIMSRLDTKRFLTENFETEDETDICN
jgi:hypothetical protein